MLAVLKEWTCSRFRPGVSMAGISFLLAHYPSLDKTTKFQIRSLPLQSGHETPPRRHARVHGMVSDDPARPWALFHLQISASKIKPLFSQWEILDSFDSANECAEARDRRWKLSDKYPQPTLLAPKTTPQINAAKYAFASCIATDDPRLKGK